MQLGVKDPELAAEPGNHTLVEESTRLVGVSRSGFATHDLDIELGPEELIAAWR